MKGNEILWAIGGAVAIYLLRPTITKEVLAVAPGFGEPLNLPEINIQLPELNYPEVNIPSVEDLMEAIPEVPLPTYRIEDIYGTIIPESSTQETISVISNLGSELDFDEIRQKAGIIAGTGAGAITAVKTIGAVPIIKRGATGILTKVAPRIAGAGAVKIGLKAIPIIGWGYLAADVGATIYELVSGKSIGGDWLGWGEAIREIF